MKALSIRQPWAHDIFTGDKEYEFRSWRTDYRGDLLICATKLPRVRGTISGHALIIMTLSDVIEVTPKNYREFGLDRSELNNGTLYAWHLTGGKVIKPIPVKGKLNLFDVDDSLIEIIDPDDGSILPEEADELYSKYFKPLES